MSSVMDIRPHIALLPGAGMGHLTPTLRLAAMLASHNCHVTLLTAKPTVSNAESEHINAFLAAYPTINRLDFQVLPYTPPDPDSADPFYVQFEAIIRSVHLLPPLLSSISPPVSALFSDITSAAGGHQVANDLGVPNYVISTTSASFSCVVSYMPYLISSECSIPIAETPIQIPGLTPVDRSNLPPLLFIPNHLFTKTLVSNSRTLSNAKGILLNTFHDFEPKTIAAVNNGKVIQDFPQFFAIGPLEPHKLEVGDHKPLPWLDQQPRGSVVYVSFGSRTAMTRDQITELRNGLEGSNQKFLWVLKSKIVDKEDSEDLEELVSDSFIERTKKQGMVVKGWVNQEAILSHPAIGGFVSHCGWNSVMEAAARGIPMLAWPLNGDQRVNAEVVESAGLGIWEKSWGWLGPRLVKGEEIAEKVTMLLADKNLREKARKIGEKAKNAVEVGGSSHRMLTEIVRNLKT